MAVSLQDLQLIYGEAGARQQFERLCSLLIQGEYPDAQSIRIVRGDGGVDTTVGSWTDGAAITVFQQKYFTKIGESQKNQIRESYDTALTNPQFTLARWILCIPIDLSGAEKSWWDNWKMKQRVPIELWGKVRLERLLLEPKNQGIKEEFFEQEHRNRIREIYEIVVKNNPTSALVSASDITRPILQKANSDLIPFSSLHQIPSPVTDFYGRTDEIATLETALRSTTQGGSGATILGIRGLAGIGKTELAYVVAARMSTFFPDAQLVINLRGASPTPLSPTAALRTAIRAFVPEQQLPEDESELSGIYRSLLTGKRVLVLADDAHNAAQVRPLIPPSGSALLLTSRSRFTLPGFVRCDLGVLPPEQAIALLRKICSRLSNAEAVEIARLSGYLPLALRISASLLENSTQPVALYLAQLATEKTRLAKLRAPDDPTLDIEATFVLSYQALSSEAQMALNHLSVFPAPFSLHAALAVLGDWPLDETPPPNAAAAIADLLDSLYHRSLLEYDEKTKRYSLHDLVRVFATARLSNPDAVAYRHAYYYANLAARADQLYFQGGEDALKGLQLFDQERSQIDAGWMWALTATNRTATDPILIDYAESIPLIGELRYHVQNERIPRLEAALQAARALGDRAAEGRLLGNLGTAYVHLSEVSRAIDYYEQRLEIARELGDRRGEGTVLGNLGNAYHDLGETRRAIDYFMQAFEILRAVGDQRGEGNNLGNLGNSYADLGEMERAVVYHEQHLEIVRATGNRRDEGAVLSNLGNAYAALGKSRKALSYHEQALEIARTLGDKWGEGDALSQLGIDYATLSDIQQAITYYEQALEVQQAVGDKRGEISTYSNLAHAYQRLGEIRRAISYYEQQLSTAQQIKAPHAEADILESLGSAYYELGKVRESIGYHEQALAIYRELEYRDGESVALVSLGLIYADSGEMHQAIRYYEQALRLQRTIGDHNKEGITLGNLGFAYAKLGQVQRAIKCYEQALEILRTVGDLQGVGDVLGNLGVAHAAVGVVQQALIDHQEQLALAEAVGNRRGISNALNHLGSDYQKLGERQQAISYYERARDIAQAIEYRRGEGQALGNLGTVYLQLGRLEDAIHCFQKVLVIMREIEDRQGEGNTLGNLGIAYAALSDVPQAISYYEQRLGLARTIGDRQGEASTSWNLGLLLKDQGDLIRAVPLLEFRVAYLEEINHPAAAESGAYVEQIRRVANMHRGWYFPILPPAIITALADSIKDWHASSVLNNASKQPNDNP